MARAEWVLGIDFGTCFTVAAARSRDHDPEVVEIDGERRTPSVLFVTEDDRLVVGKVAQDLAASAPDRALAGPKSQLGEAAPIVLGGRPYKPEDLVAAILGHVTDQVVDHMGIRPSQVRMTRPATWGRTRCDALIRAATEAGLDQVHLVEEPVAAALSLVGYSHVNEGRFVAVYDFGGGTFDTAVLRADAERYNVVGVPAGDEALGGELIDELVLESVIDRLPAELADSLQVPPDLEWTRSRALLRAESRRAKEILSSHPQADVRVSTPIGLRNVRVERTELESIMRPHIRNSVEILRRCLDVSGIRAEQLEVICLAGGMSRVPMVQQMVQVAFPEANVRRTGDPKTSVAAGSTLLGEPRPSALAARPAERTTLTAPAAFPTDPAHGAAAPAALQSPDRGRRSSSVRRGVYASVASAALALAAVAGIAVLVSRGQSGHPTSRSLSLKVPGTATVAARTPVPTISSTTSSTTTETTSSVPPSPTEAATAELQSGWIVDPGKCGPGPTDHSAPYSSARTYQVTAPVHLWSEPSVTSQPLDVITVSSFGPAGIGCPSGSDPRVVVTCKATGEPITGPFGTDAYWDATTWNGQSGYLPDEWVDTKWDLASLPNC